ncbi:hypothetical protein CYLTODRAFT_493514 [Cylindrobasidium torrendii FP15055 ss-10]|uniref:Uncharacterized protein n=1 Tax=Cylindrobasidium torrendii FP15055 ss-10 TaxID=1314674 RepID=A0A0D7B160_9AGAR|nr:hypothetical protein CYLTODRAFT_493514 [Cylindrobasidium torrendii FP15055 ss-10]
MSLGICSPGDLDVALPSSRGISQVRTSSTSRLRTVARFTRAAALQQRSTMTGTMRTHDKDKERNGQFLRPVFFADSSLRDGAFIVQLADPSIHVPAIALRLTPLPRELTTPTLPTGEGVYARSHPGRSDDAFIVLLPDPFIHAPHRLKTDPNPARADHTYTPHWRRGLRAESPRPMRGE